MASLPFVDTHVHYWDLTLASLRYSWLDRDAVHPVLGDIDGLKVLKYTAEHYVGETRFHNVRKCVHVQAAIGSPDPVEETRWLQEQANRMGIPNGIVAHCNLAARDVAATLERHMSYANVRGVRDFGYGDYLVDADWQKGYEQLGPLGLVFCLDVVPEDLGKARALADRYPGVVLCVDHAGFPRRRDPVYFQMWRRAMADVAGAPNVVCKISGLGMCDHGWSVNSIRPWVLSCIELFGADRTFFGTNWPVDRLYSSYGDVVDAYATIIAGASAGEQAALFAGNAERVFRI